MDVSKIFKLKNKRGFFVAYDHGLEHGPKDFVSNKLSYDPKYIINIAYKSKANAIIFQPGNYFRYKEVIKKHKLKTIVKINGKTSMTNEKYFSGLTLSLDKIADLGAEGVGYTIYFGSPYEPKMIETFSRIRDIAKDYSMASVLWAYVRSPHIKHDTKKEYIAYALRAAYELGADMIKIKYTGDKKSFEYALSSIPFDERYVFVAGGVKSNDFLKIVKEVIDAGANGLAVGRNIWAAKDPLYITNKIKEVLYGI